MAITANPTNGNLTVSGRVTAAAVSVPLKIAEKLLANEWSAINDSKKLSEKKRFALAEVIKSTPGCRWAVASASPAEIDRLNILNATHLAMRRAAEKVEVEGRGRQRKDQNLCQPQPLTSTFRILVDGLPVKSLVAYHPPNVCPAFVASVGKVARLKDVLQSGQGMREEPMEIIITTAGFDKLGPCYEKRQTCTEILGGVKTEDSTFAIIYTLDDGDDWKDGAVWVKANPNIGVTVREDYLRRMVEKAENTPSEEVGIRTKNLNTWVDAETVWIPDHYIVEQTHGRTLDEFAEFSRSQNSVNVTKTVFFHFRTVLFIFFA